MTKTIRHHARTVIVGLCLSLGAVSAAFATGDTTGVVIPDPIALATGGFHAARAQGGLTTIFDNPAGFVAVKPSFNITELGTTVSGPIFNIASLLASGGGDMSSLLSSLLDSQGRLYAGIDAPGPVALGYVGNGFGFGFFNRSIATVDVKGLTSASLSSGEEMLLTGGYAFRIPLAATQFLDIGIQAKGFIRGLAKRSGTLLDVSGWLSDPSNALWGAPWYMTTGIGADLGLRYSLGDWFSVGLVAHDIYSPTSMKEYTSVGSFFSGSDTGKAAVYGLVPMNLAAGVMFTPSLGPLDRYISSFRIMLDYQDIVGTFQLLARNPILNVGAGIDLTLLDVLSLRGGIYEGLLNAGLGLNLSWFSLNLAVYGTELSLEPGGRPVYNLFLGMNFKA